MDITTLALAKSYTNQKFGEASDASKSEAISAIAAEGTRQKGLVTSEGTRQIGLVTSEGTRQIGLVNAAGSEKIGELETKATEIENSWPSDYSELTTKVTNVEKDLVNIKKIEQTFYRDAQGYLCEY